MMRHELMRSRVEISPACRKKSNIPRAFFAITHGRIIQDCFSSDLIIKMNQRRFRQMPDTCTAVDYQIFVAYRTASRNLAYVPCLGVSTLPQRHVCDNRVVSH